MNILKSSKVYRGGKTSNKLVVEDTSIKYYTSSSDNTVNIYFSIRSKGGGSTELLVEIDQADLKSLLTEVAGDLPEVYASLLDKNVLADVLIRKPLLHSTVLEVLDAVHRHNVKTIEEKSRLALESVTRSKEAFENVRELVRSYWFKTDGDEVDVLHEEVDTLIDQAVEDLPEVG
jgi:hypothetical protein